LFYDHAGNTLTVWFDNPQDEYICEETGDEVILMKNKSGSVIGFENRRTPVRNMIRSFRKELP